MIHMDTWENMRMDLGEYKNITENKYVPVHYNQYNVYKSL